MYLKQMAPCEIMVKNHLIYLGHFDGIPIRGKKDYIIDFMIIAIIHELSLSEPVYIREYNLHGAGRQGSRQHTERWFSEAIKERERCQIAKHGRMVGRGRDQIIAESTKKILTLDGTEFGEKLNRIVKNIEILMMTELNMKNSMANNEYRNYTLKKL